MVWYHGTGLSVSVTLDEISVALYLRAAAVANSDTARKTHHAGLRRCARCGSHTPLMRGSLKRLVASQLPASRVSTELIWVVTHDVDVMAWTHAIV